MKVRDHERLHAHPSLSVSLCRIPVPSVRLPRYLHGCGSWQCGTGPLPFNGIKRGFREMRVCLGGLVASRTGRYGGGALRSLHSAPECYITCLLTH